VPIAQLEISNPSAFPRRDTALYLSYYDLGLERAMVETQQLAVKAADAVLPSQAVDADGDGAKDGLVALVDLDAAETKTLTLTADARASLTRFPKRTQAEISHKVGGTWKPREKDPKLQEYVGGTFQNVRELTPPSQYTDHGNFIRYEGPGIESDKVGYRVYLDWRNGFDIFGKKVTRSVLQDIGQDGYDSYHELADWGMDILKVGESLGTGGFGFWTGRKVALVSKVQQRHATITENGNVYSAFQIQYKGWEINQQTVDLTADLSMTAGSRLVHARLGLSEDLPNLAVGIVKHPTTELIQGPTDITGRAYTYVGSWGKQSLNHDMLGMAILFKRGSRASQDQDQANYVSVVTPAGKQFEYYFLAAWAAEPGGIQTKEAFVHYLDEEAERLTLTVRQRLKTALSEAAKSFPIEADTALEWSKKLADSELERKTLAYRHDGWDAYRERKPKFEYDIVGLQPMAYDELNAVAPDPKYEQVMEKVTGSYVTEQGKILAYDEAEYNIDAVMPGRVLLRLYEKTKQDKYRKSAAQLRRQLKRQPRTGGGAFWHKKRYRWQLWLDGVYMAMPFLARYSTRFEKGKSLDEVVTEFTVARAQLRNPETGLYVHAWDEKRKQSWADPKTGRSKFVWGRGLGWYAMAVVDVLDFIPEDDEAHRRPLLDIIGELAPALVKHQDQQTHTWWQIMDQPGAPGNYRESSASAMLTYFFAKAVRKGYLEQSYRGTAVKSYAGLIREFVRVHPDGKVSLTNQCLVGGLGFGRDGSYRYYMSEPVVENDPKGNGPFILAGVEVYRLLGEGSK
jgi:unsaturated rhamnogalacturonyl hydrolase